MRWALHLILISLLSTCALGAEVAHLCDVLRKPTDYRGKELIITAGFRVGFEWQVLICYECPSTCRTCDDERVQVYDVWVNFGQNVKGASKLPKVKVFDQLEKGTFRGAFEGPGPYGHLGGYRYQFNVNQVDAAMRVWKIQGKEKDAPENIKALLCTLPDGKTYPQG